MERKQNPPLKRALLSHCACAKVRGFSIDYAKAPSIGRRYLSLRATPAIQPATARRHYAQHDEDWDFILIPSRIVLARTNMRG
jgi:hypothetical protein